MSSSIKIPYLGNLIAVLISLLWLLEAPFTIVVMVLGYIIMVNLFASSGNFVPTKSFCCATLFFRIYEINIYELAVTDSEVNSVRKHNYNFIIG